MKETFIIRTEWMDSILELDAQGQATIMQNLFYFHSNKENLINLNNLSVKLVWKLIEPNLKRNISAYDKRVETSKINGKLGGRPKVKCENQKKPKKPKKPNETLSVFDSVSVSDSVIDNKLYYPESKVYEIFMSDTLALEYTQRERSVESETAKAMMESFYQKQKAQGKVSTRPYEDFRNHYINTVPKMSLEAIKVSAPKKKKTQGWFNSYQEYVKYCETEGLVPEKEIRA